MIATNVILDIVLFETYKKGIEIWCVNGFKQCCYPVFVGLIIDYKEQVLITSVKTNMQCFIYHVLPKEREHVIKKWKFQTQKSIWE